MAKSTLLTQIARKKADKDAIAGRVVRQPELLLEVYEGLSSDKADIKYGCLKVLRIVSERKPAMLYPSINRLISLLDCDNNFLKWGAIIIIANLAAVDSRKKIERLLDRYLQPIRGHVMITAANVIGSAAKIALAKPELAGKIAQQMLKVERAEYQTDECRNVAIGHAIESLDRFFDHIAQKQVVVEFVKRQLANRRNAVRRKAAGFLKRHGLGPSMAPKPAGASPRRKMDF